MNPDEQYLFDLNGYIVIEEALTPDEVERCNSALDHHPDSFHERTDPLAADSKTLAGRTNRIDVGGMLEWERPWCEPFREFLFHPRVAPYLNQILGKGYRLDHGPGVIAMEPGCEGGLLHGGGAERTDFSEAYFFKNDRIYTGLTVVEYMLADEGPAEGGVAVIPGSHKSNLPCPRGITHYERYQEHVVKVPLKTRDVLIFTEALTHGTLPWRGTHQRRALLYKFSPGFQAYSPGSHQVSFPDYILDMTEEQRAVMQPPYFRKRG